MTGMDFETRREIHGRQVHFAMHNEELVIRTRSQESVCKNWLDERNTNTN